MTVLCLAFLLLILSGDVETNPGPTITDKPTKDGMIKILNSSKLVNCWENFVCLLPNMTQEIINDIKERETRVSESTENVTSSIAQHLLSSDQLTLRDIIIALVKADEVNLANDILESIVKHDEGSHVDTEDLLLKGMQKTLKVVMNANFSLLHNITKYHVSDLAIEMYSRKLICAPSLEFPTYDKLCHDFQAALPFKKDIASLEECCMSFLNSIACLEGPALKAAELLACHWEREVKRIHDVDLSLKIGFPPYVIVSKVIGIHSQDELACDVRSLQIEYISIIYRIITFYRRKEQTDIENMALFLSEFLDERGFLLIKNAEELFDKLKPFYSYLNCETLEELIKMFPIEKTLQSEFKSYLKKLKLFSDTRLAALKTSIKIALEPEPQDEQIQTSKLTTKVVIKMKGIWEDKMVRSLNKLVEHLFRRKKNMFNLISIEEGSLIITFLVPFSQLPSIHHMVKEKAQYMSDFGIFYLSIDDRVIINEKECVNYTFERSLFQAISNVTNDKEYERIALFLIELEINFNYQNENGQTALMLACELGHYRIVEHLIIAMPNVLISRDYNEWKLYINGPNMSIQDCNGSTALMAASQHGHDKVVDILLNNEVNTGICDKDGETALMRACHFGHHRVVELLLTKEQNVNIRRKDGSTALTIAIQSQSSSCELNPIYLNNFDQIIELLLDHGANPHITVKFEDKLVSMLTLAAGSNNFNCVQMLTRKCEFSTKELVDCFTTACYKGLTSIMSLLCEKLTLDDKELLVAIIQDNESSVVSKLVNPDKPLVGSMTPLMIAASCGHSHIVELMLLQGVNTNITNDDGLTALKIVNDISNRDEIIDLLLKKNTACPLPKQSAPASLSESQPITESPLSSKHLTEPSLLEKAKPKDKSLTNHLTKPQTKPSFLKQAQPTTNVEPIIETQPIEDTPSKPKIRKEKKKEKAVLLLPTETY